MRMKLFVFWFKNIRAVNLFNWTLKIRGYDIAFAKAKLAQIQAISSEDYAAYVTVQKERILDYHKTHTSFYKRLLENTSATAWEDLPILTKADLQQKLENRLSKEYSKNQVYINKTSGSSGHPFVFAKDKVSHALTWAVIQDRFEWYELDFNRSLQARFYGIPLEGFGYRKERVKDALSHRYRFPIFNLNDKALKEVLESFTKKPFEYINGYTSSIVLLAKYLKKREVFLKDVCPSLKACVVTSEMLFDDDKLLLEKQFKVPVINEYGASELDLIAFQNIEGDFQVNSETLFIEIVDENNRPVPNGTEGRIIVTSLYNKAHPFIRYDIGDIGILSEKSTPKKPILKQLIGRTNDIARLPSGKVVPGLTFYYVTKSVIDDGGDIKEFIVQQTKPDTFEINYVGEVMLSQKRIGKIKEALDKYIEPGLHIIVNKFDKIERQKSGKLKQFTSLTT